MRAWLGILTAAMIFATEARADAPTTMYVTNYGAQPSRVQVAVGSTFPCDSSDNHLLLDAVLAPGERRTLFVNGIIVCARNTSGGSVLDWGPSQWLLGGYRCRTRKGPCWVDPSVPIVFDVLLR
jgi:hypothetical protein